MATTRIAKTHWEGTLFEGAGKVTLESSGLGTFDVTWPARAEEADGKTSPEELIAAAHSACFSMAFSNGLAKNGTPATALDTKAEVDFVPGTGITGIQLTVVGTVDGIARRSSSRPPRTPRRTARSARRSPAPRSRCRPRWPDAAPAGDVGPASAREAGPSSSGRCVTRGRAALGSLDRHVAVPDHRCGSGISMPS